MIENQAWKTGQSVYPLLPWTPPQQVALSPCLTGYLLIIRSARSGLETQNCPKLIASQSPLLILARPLSPLKESFPIRIPLKYGRKVLQTLSSWSLEVMPQWLTKAQGSVDSLISANATFLWDIPLRRQPNVCSGFWSNISLALETGESLMASCQGSKYCSAISKSSRQQRALFSGEPPYWSVRVLLQDLRNWSMRQPCAPWSWTPSKPACLASLRLCSNSACVCLISSWLISWGSGATVPPRYLIFSRQSTAEGAQASRPKVISGLVALPACASCTKILPPLWCTASVTSRHPCACSSEQRPGEPWEVRPRWHQAVVSVKMSAAEARCPQYSATRGVGTPVAVQRSLVRADMMMRLGSSRPPTLIRSFQFNS